MRSPSTDGVGRVKVAKSPPSPTRAFTSRAQRAADDNQDPRFAQLAGSLPLLVWTAAADGTLSYVNDAFATYTGRSVESLLGGQWVAIVGPDERDPVSASWRSSVKTGNPWTMQFHILRADGSYRWHHVRARADRDEAGRAERWWGNAVDVHEYRLLEQQAVQRAIDREAILDSVGDGVFALDREWRFTYLNRDAAALLGRTRESLMGKVLWDEFPEMRDSDLGLMLIRVLKTGKRERILDRRGALQSSFDAGASPMVDGLAVSLHDITPIKVLSEQLIAAQRLEALGQLTGGVAHDFNNLLTVVMGAAESLALEPGLGSKSRDMLDLVTRASMSGAELTRRLLAFARREPLEPESIDISRRLGDLVPLLTQTLGEGIEVASSLAPGLPLALVDAGQFESAILNLAINARDAMPDGGILTLETALTEIDEEFAAAHGDVTPGPFVIVAVGDTGTGIAPETMGHVFDPFFTTKPIGRGSGLGLAMVWGFARQSGGYVTAYSELGTGTAFRLYLPVVGERPDISEPVAAVRTPTPRGVGNVLLVEDDDLVRSIAADQLTAHGYTVTAVSSGPEALKALDTIEPVDLLFSDIMLPGGMTGRQLATEIHTRRPGTPVLLTSGYSESVLVHGGQLDPTAVLLPKPYSSRQMLDAVQRLLHPPETPPDP